MPILIMQTATGETRRVELKPAENTVGRGPRNDIVIDSVQASRVHAVIDVEQAFVTIRDLESRNGTFVDDVRVENQVLADGDIIRLGSYEMRFSAGDQEFSQIEAPQVLQMPGLRAEMDWTDAATVPDVPPGWSRTQ